MSTKDDTNQVRQLSETSVLSKHDDITMIDQQEQVSFIIMSSSVKQRWYAFFLMEYKKLTNEM